jgi:hypothetical protein
VTGTLTLSPTGTLTQNAGSTLNAATFIQAGGTVNGTLQNQGSFIYQSGQFNGRLLNQGTVSLPPSFTFPDGVENDTTINSGTLTATQAGGTISASIVSNSPTTININADNVSLGNPASFTGFNHQGVLNVGVNTVTLNSAGYAKLGVLTTLNGGTINAPNGVTLPSGTNVFGHGVINARLTGESGAVIEADGALALGDAASPAGYVSNGELRTKQFTVTLNSSGAVGLGNLTALGSGASPGTLTATNGYVVDFDEAVTGYGTINSSNALAKRATINGTVQGTSSAQPITLSGYIKGTGSFTNVVFTGTHDPGLSPTFLSVGNVAYADTALLSIELGGTTRGSQYDAIVASGNLSLSGVLQLSLINGFIPVAGDSFDILDWNTLSGAFSSLIFPTLGTGLTWNTSQLYATGVLSVAATVLVGDYNGNGIVDAADYIVWRNGLGTIYTQNDYDVWRAHFGEHAGSGTGAIASATVPEPATLVMLLAGVPAIFSRRRWVVS